MSNAPRRWPFRPVRSLSRMSNPGSGAGLLDVVHHWPYCLHVHASDGVLVLVHVLQRAKNAGIAAGEGHDEVVPAPGQRLRPGVGWWNAGVHYGLHFGLEVGPHLRTFLDRL